MAKILGLDVGNRKIGVALGDTETQLAFPRPALLVERMEDAWEQLAFFVRAESIAVVIVGWPLNDDGTAGAQTERVEAFVGGLAALISVPILKRDERHTSQAVQREQTAAGRSMHRGQEDSLVAQLLVESYLTEVA